MTRTRTWNLPVPVGVNLLLGIPAIVPLFLAWYIIVNGPLAALGWTQRNPNEDDGMLLWLVIAAPVFCLFGLIWGLANLRMRRRTATSASQYWIACVIASLAPYIVGFFLF
ncbi:hypothetical protein Strop_0652 [Salinispora tropica CNB-440]|uniref:Integral membrane protein n=1 Tax=Salinispora tropica (strain ATCC BAA-916 / DSM 44818 / JCM 13857 / NBRC 105044 / CNB-440) TaxID=369723 RepID=A4X2M9_SALTO|nr:hypothetical protein Strop_0652 [Salinispora tropica CNB-440]